MPEALHKCKANCKGASMAIKPYIQQLQARARRKRIDLKAAFIHAGVADSTYYRALAGRCDLNFRTASKVMDAIEQLANHDTIQSVV